MRFVVYGAGAVGGVLGSRLAQHGHSVVLIARGAHYEAIRADGLRFESPDDMCELRLPVFNNPAEMEWQADEVVLLAMKAQDTEGALASLAAVAPAHLPIVCVQNGVANERMALRRFANIYGVFVYCAAGHLTPGVVRASFAPTTGILDIGRYPTGVDETSEEIAAAFRRSSFQSEARPDIMRWKYRKLLMNLGNAVEALCGPAARGISLVRAARHEGVDCLNAARIPFLAVDDAGARRREKELVARPIGGDDRLGGSTWQSLARHQPTVEVDYLNGEIVLLGRLHDVPTPINADLQRLANQAARERRPAGSMTIGQLEAAVDYRQESSDVGRLS